MKTIDCRSHFESKRPELSVSDGRRRVQLRCKEPRRLVRRKDLRDAARMSRTDGCQEIEGCADAGLFAQKKRKE